MSESHQPRFIKGKRNSAVLVSEEDWQAMEDTLYLASIPGMLESIKKGSETPLKDCITLEEAGIDLNEEI